MNTIVIDTPWEFNFQQCLHFLKRSPHEVLHHIEDDKVEKVIVVDGKTILVKVSAHGQQQLLVHVLNRRLLPLQASAIIRYMEDWFDLKTNLQPFYQMAEKDQLLQLLVCKFFGYRMVSIPDLFESLCWAIIGQQINLTFAYKLKRNFVLAFGTKYTWRGKTCYHFPSPQAVAALSPVALLELQFSRQKAEYVINVARIMRSGNLSKENLSLLSFQDALKELILIKGIGSWTANYVLMKTFHFPNAFPLLDAGLQQAIRKHLHLGPKISSQQIEKLFKKYAGWEAYATLYLWRSLSDDR